MTQGTPFFKYLLDLNGGRFLAPIEPRHQENDSRPIGQKRYLDHRIVYFTEKSLNFTEINPRSVYFYEKDPKLSTNRRAVQNFAKKKKKVLRPPAATACSSSSPSRRAAVPPTGPPRRDAVEKET